MVSPFTDIEVTAKAATRIKRVTYNAEALYHIIDQLPNSPEKSLAIARLEECVMWANKCAARNI